LEILARIHPAMIVTSAAVTVRVGDRIGLYTVADISHSQESARIYFHVFYQRTKRSNTIHRVDSYYPMDMVTYQRTGTL